MKYDGGLKKSVAAKRLPPVVLQKGQKWELADGNIQIGIVGKRLVHYKHFRGQVKRASLSIASIATLENFLTENKAVCIEQAPAPVVAAS